MTRTHEGLPLVGDSPGRLLWSGDDSTSEPQAGSELTAARAKLRSTQPKFELR
jgi:hypothetical protein